MEQPDWFCDQETALEERRGNENAKLVSAYFLWHCCGGSERLGGNDKLGLRRYTLDCPPPLTSCLPLSFPALSLSLLESWRFAIALERCEPAKQDWKRGSSLQKWRRTWTDWWLARLAHYLDISPNISANFPNISPQFVQPLNSHFWKKKMQRLTILHTYP